MTTAALIVPAPSDPGLRDPGSRDVGLAPLEAEPIERLLALGDVTEIMVNGNRGTYVERAGQVEAVAAIPIADVMRFIERVITPLGLRLDRSSPIVEARLTDGSRLHAIIPPVAIDGVQLCVRRFAVQPFTLAEFGLPPEVADLVRALVTQGRNVVVSGGTSTGKTSLLNALAADIPRAARVVTIEETAELRLATPHVVRLETRPANAEGVGEITMRQLVRTALRLRPDRLVIGEVRGAESFDLIQALHTGHAGSMCTVHANDPLGALRRLEHLALLAATGLGARALRTQIAAGLDVVVHLARDRRGRFIREIARVAGDELVTVWAP